MYTKNSAQAQVEEEWEESARKRVKVNGTHDSLSREPNSENGALVYDERLSDAAKDKSITIASTAKLAGQTVAPFLARHIPDQYAPLGSKAAATKDPNSKYCYRHRPDTLCRRQADEMSMDKLQRGIEALPQDDRQGIAQVWSLFSAAPAKHRKLMLQGILAQCCFPQLSYLSANVRELIRIDFISALPSEIAFKILCFLDTASLCRAAQVSRKWRQLADDDVVWHRMCEQHIERKCTRCGWGLPLLERKRLRATKRQIQLRAIGQQAHGPASSIPAHFEREKAPSIASDPDSLSDIERTSDGRLSPVAYRRPYLGTSDSDSFRKARPWKDVYKDRFKVGTNWKYGRCSVKIFKGHSNGVITLQFYDNILATGSYDATIKIWDTDTGAELRTLRGHSSGVRCLQFDDSKLISGSLDSTLKVWNWRTGECISTYDGHSDGIISLHFDANILVSGSIDKTAKIWNFQDKSRYTLRGHSDWVNCVRIDTPSRTVFTASDDCTVKLWDLDTQRCIRTYEGHVGQIQQVLPLPSEFEAEEDEPDPGNHTDHTEDLPSTPDSVTASHRSPYARRSEEPFASANATVGHNTVFPSSLPTSSSTLSEALRPPPPRYMLTASLDSTIRLWEVSTGRCVRTYFGHVEGVWAVAADTLRIVSGAQDRMVKVWDPRTERCERTFTGHAGPVTCIGLSDSRMCSGSEDGEVRMYNFF